MKLLIFEKPKQAKSICEAFQHESKKGHIFLKPQPHFPNGAIAVWCVGHILEQSQPNEINPEWKQWKYEHLPIAFDGNVPNKVVKSRRTEFENIKRFVKDKKISEIYHIADAGQEGQLIVDEVLYFIRNTKPVKRVWLNSLEKSAVLKAFNNIRPNEEFRSYYDAAIARQFSDYLIGMNGSRALTLLLSEKGIRTVFPVGRVQSSLMRILVERDRAITEFKSTPYFELIGSFDKQEVTFQAKYENGEERLTDKEQALALAKYLQGKDSEVELIEEKEEEIPPPRFFNLTSLIGEMNKITKQSPEQIQEVAQSLYESGYISYPRALPVVVNPEEALTFPDVLAALHTNGWGTNHLPAPFTDIVSNKRYVDSTKTDDHYAIIPTIKVPNVQALVGEERLMYEMIANRLITAHYPPAKNSVMTSSILVDDEFSFVLKEKRMLEPGWKVCVTKEDEDESNSLRMPALEKGELLNLKHVEVEEKMTTAPKRFTQGQLPTVMENISAYLPEHEKIGLGKTELSLGTVATRSNIIQLLMERKYITVKKNNVFVLAKGFVLIDALGKENFVSSPRTTGLMEQFLNQICSREKLAQPYIERTKELVTQMIHDLREQSSMWQFDPTHVTEIQAAIEKENAKRNKTVGTREVIGKCLLCEGDVLDRGTFYGCSNYREKDCSFSISKEFLGQRISKEQAIKIIHGRKTDILPNFISNNSGKPFSAILVWNETKKQLVFEFPQRIK